MASIEFTFTYTPGKLEEFIVKLQSVGAPAKISTDFPKSVGFGSSHARGFPAVLKYAGLLDSSAQPTEAYKKGLRGGVGGRHLVGDAILQAYKPMFDMYPDAPTRPDLDLVTFVKSHSDLDNEKAGLVVKTFKVLCKFGTFEDARTTENGGGADNVAGSPSRTGAVQRKRPDRAGSGGAVVINVNISLSVDATSDAAVYDAFFAAMAKHLQGLMDGGD